MNTLQNWDHDLDGQIIRMIERDGTTYFYRLWKELKVSRNELDHHLKVMEEQGIIEKDLLKEIGKKRYIRLTETTIGLRRLGVFRGVIRQAEHKKKRNNENDDQIQNDIRLLVLLLLRAATGITNLKKVKTPDVKEEYFIIEDLRGVSVEDIARFQDNIDLLSNNQIFAYLKIPKESIRSMVCRLKDEMDRYPDLGPIFDLALYVRYDHKNGKEKRATMGVAKSGSISFNSRFELSTSSKSQRYELKRFLVYCDAVLMFVITRMEMKWFSGERPKTKEVEWYKNIFGREASDSFFLRKLRPMRKILYKGRVYSSKKIKDNRDKRVKQFYIELFDERQKKYKNIEKRYPMFYKIVTDIIFPSFLRDDIVFESPNKRASSVFTSVPHRRIGYCSHLTISNNYFVTQSLSMSS